MRGFPLVVAFAVLVATFAFGSPATEAQNLVPVTVTILHVQEINNIDDELFETAWGDQYAVVEIDGERQRTPTHDQSFNIGTHFPSPIFTINESLTFMVDRSSGSLPFRIELWDQDSPSNDDRYNIGSDTTDPGLDMTLDVAAGTWSGENGVNSGFTQGVRGFRARVWFDVALGPTGDLDGDGIPDGIERFGIRDTDGNVELDLGALGAHPCRKSVAVELDYYELTSDHTHRPEPSIESELTAAFDASPVAAITPCPYVGLVTGADGTGILDAPQTGIDFVLDVDERIEFNDAGAEAAPIDVAETNPSLETYAASNLSNTRRPYVHYALWAHNHPRRNTGQCCGDGDDDGLQNGDFLITRGDPSTAFADRRAQAGTFMHEFGHALGLSHGGPPSELGAQAAAVNRKPNYRSVMSYTFSSTGVPQFQLTAAITTQADLARFSILDYSRRSLNSLDESALDEAQGIDPTVQVPSGFAPITFWWDAAGNMVAADARDPVDWNGNGTIEGTVSGVDINLDRVCVDPGVDQTLQTSRATGDLRQTLQSRFAAAMFPAIVTGPDRDCDTTALASSDDEQERPVGFSQPNVLVGGDDWSNLCFKALLATTECSLGDAFDEITLEQEARIRQAMLGASIDFFDEPPTADAGGPYTASEAQPVQLDGTASSDPAGDELSFEWSPAARFADATSATPTYLAGDNLEEVVTLTVTDSAGQQSTAETIVTVANQPPALTISEPERLALPAISAVVAPLGAPRTWAATGTDPGSDDLTFEWSTGVTTTILNAPPDPDPPASPEGAFPFTARDEMILTPSTGVHEVSLVLRDDDGGAVSGVASLLMVSGDMRRAHGLGWWKFVFSRRHKPRLGAQDRAALLEFVRAGSTIFGEETPLDDDSGALDALRPNNGSRRALTTSVLFVAWLNVAGGAIEWDDVVELPRRQSATVGEIVTDAEALLRDPQSSAAAFREILVALHRSRHAH